MKNALAAAALLSFLTTLSAAPLAAEDAATPWVVDYGASALGFSGTQTGQAFDGVFEKWTATVILDPENLENASIEAVIDLASAKTGDKQRDKAMPGKEWFNVKSTPQATFRSSAVTATGDGAYEAQGTLSLKGASKPVTLPFTLAIDGNAAKAKGATTLIRTEYNVGEGQFSTGEWVGLDVEVTVSIVATRP